MNKDDLIKTLSSQQLPSKPIKNKPPTLKEIFEGLKILPEWLKKLDKS